MASEALNKYIEKRYDRWLDYAKYHCSLAGMSSEAIDVLNEVMCMLLQKPLEHLSRLMEAKQGKYTELDWYILQMIKLNVTSDTSPYRHKYKPIPVDENVDWRRLNIIDEPDDSIDRTEYIRERMQDIRDMVDLLELSEKEMNLELKEQDSEHNKKKKEEGSPKRKKGCFKRVLSVLVLVVIIGFSFLAGRQSVMTSNAYGTGLNNGKILRKLSMLEAFAGNYYLNKIDAENVENNIYKGFAKGLQDPYAEYYTPSEYQQLSEEDAGKYNGIGISIAKDTDTNYPEVVSVFKDQPAYKAGIKNGDLITAIDQKSTADMELQDVVSAIRSEDNDKVVLTIYRDKKTKDYTVEKTSVELDSVTYKMRKNKIGYIAVSQFHENTDEQFDKAVTDLESQGMKSLIIDLRDDGGGLLTTCTNMLSRLVAKDKMLVYTKDKKGKKEEFKSDSGKTVDVPMVVLVNGNTASASEIMTGCLKDYKKATVVGTTTYGKGIVQTILPLTDGSAFKFTIAKYYTPKGTDIHEKGIKPDVEVKMSDKQWKKRTA